MKDSIKKVINWLLQIILGLVLGLTDIYISWFLAVKLLVFFRIKSDIFFIIFFLMNLFVLTSLIIKKLEKY